MKALNLIVNLTNAISLVFILIIALAAPTIDAQVILPVYLFPEFLTDFTKWYAGEFGNYLIVDKPFFFLGIAWVQLLVNWPLSILSLYALVAKKHWFSTTCLALGFSFLSAMAAILAELLGSGRASQQLLIFYFTFLGFDFLTILRGLLPISPKVNHSLRKEHSALNQKKTS
ncbi:hypothetical protein LguiA_035264 [Lonicera macranthoides]